MDGEYIQGTPPLYSNEDLIHFLASREQVSVEKFTQPTESIPSAFNALKKGKARYDLEKYTPLLENILSQHPDFTSKESALADLQIIFPGKTLEELDGNYDTYKSTYSRLAQIQIYHELEELERTKTPSALYRKYDDEKGDDYDLLYKAYYVVNDKEFKVN